MDKEDKQVDQVVDVLLTRSNDLKNNIQQLIWKFENEYETLQWPAVLDNFALISGQMNNLLKVLRNDKIPKLRNWIILPLLVSPDPDPELQRLTEGRVPLFNHQAVPDYLRTLCDPEIERADQMILMKASQSPSDGSTKQVASHNKICQQVSEVIRSSREEWDIDTSRGIQQTSSAPDTAMLISAISTGKLLRGGNQGPGLGGQTLGTHSPKPMGASIGGPIGGGPVPNRGMNAPPTAGGKIPTATIKTNIKSGGAMSSHPYMR
ncbi:mediator of RNA polymerase II transcription subunit 8-like [Tropilaelaps mercedesae]|uniref:Mediator of RNA polymerase II transcription subunit 8 n=1 Tax=Tropilaelaps mercedesae TaxID=418985 RepID=A0A1V9X5K1_9ACAR|nr:mediator of RNA polymerase II transcription subunit 8-like [Tropilaelaps mercedesae]